MVLIKIILTIKKERLMLLMEGHSVFLRKHWTAGREVKEVVGCWVGLALEGLPCMFKPRQREDQVHSGLERSWLFCWAGLHAGPVTLWRVGDRTLHVSVLGTGKDNFLPVVLQ